MHSQLHLFRSLTLTLAGLLVSSTPSWSEDQFTYFCDTCPTAWSEIAAACGEGTAQSPIAFSPGDAKRRKLQPLRVRFEETDLELRTLETNFKAKVHGGGFKLGKKKFELLQFHFHSPSEHMVGGERTPLEAHFVHLGEDGSRGLHRTGQAQPRDRPADR